MSDCWRRASQSSPRTQHWKLKRVPSTKDVGNFEPILSLLQNRSLFLILQAEFPHSHQSFSMKLIKKNTYTLTCKSTEITISESTSDTSSISLELSSQASFSYSIVRKITSNVINCTLCPWLKHIYLKKCCTIWMNYWIF